MDSISTVFAFHYDSKVVEQYNYFKRNIRNTEIIVDNDKNNNKDDNFDPDKYIEELENDYFTALRSMK